MIDAERGWRKLIEHLQAALDQLKELEASLPEAAHS